MVKKRTYCNHHTTYWQHPDHLGSASWVTDTNGTAWQHLQYMPWGEPFVDLRNENDGYETRYTFSGKERDEETGFSYFGARHYNSSLSIWLSVDPMSDKYPSMSPYAYCANNPAVLKDPNGEDIWEIDECGRIVASYENKDFDQVHIVNSNGVCVAKSDMYDAHTFQLNCQEGTTLLSSDNTDATRDMFFFISDNMGVEVESYTTNVTSFIGMSQDRYNANTVTVAKDLENFTAVYKHIHSHPGGYGIPSKKDYDVACKNPAIELYIYVPNNGVSLYDKYTPYLDQGKMVYDPLLGR